MARKKTVCQVCGAFVVTFDRKETGQGPVHREYCYAIWQAQQAEHEEAQQGQ